MHDFTSMNKDFVITIFYGKSEMGMVDYILFVMTGFLKP